MRDRAETPIFAPTIHIPLDWVGLGYGVMVAQDILVVLVLVRNRIAQPKRSMAARRVACHAFFFHARKMGGHHPGQSSTGPRATMCQPGHAAASANACIVRGHLHAAAWGHAPRCVSHPGTVGRTAHTEGARPLPEMAAGRAPLGLVLAGWLPVRLTGPCRLQP